ncbi:MAG TPA: metallophosphoesterase [Pyrinomonadaceae bacterium]|nr:metallophosphoesterase [Pyrinomonadaceae bacterium]
MNARTLTLIFLTLLLSAAAHAQTGSSYPPLSQVPSTVPLTDDPTSTHFTFIAAGDNRPSGPRDKQPETLRQILTDAKQHKPSFMLWSGDTIAGFRIVGKKMNRDALKTQYKEFFDIAAKAGVPVFNSPGNHEMDSLDKTSAGNVERPDLEMQQLYLEMMKYPSGAPPYGAFNYGNSRFIAVDTEEAPSMLTLRSPGKVVANNVKLDPGYVSPTQIKLLASDLEANKHKAHIFVFMHHPIKPARKGSQLNKDTADELEALFAKYPNVSYVIAAHEHLYYNASGNTLNPPTRTDPSSTGPGYLVSGGAGAPLDSCPGSATQNCSSTYHYLVFEVNGDKVDVKVVMISGNR